MRDYHGIIFAYNAAPALRELVSVRTAASLPFCGRYRLVDLALSSLRNAGILDAGIIVQRDYQSLLDHIGSGKAWDMSRKSGGLRVLPPFGLPEFHRGNYVGTIEALNAVSSYIKDIPQSNIVLLLGQVVANIDLDAVITQHEKKGAEITAICADIEPDSVHHKYIVGEDGYASRAVYDRLGESEGLTALEGYVIKKELLVEMMDECKAQSKYRFHQDAIAAYLEKGGKINIYVHEGYSAIVRTVDSYYNASMDMLTEKRKDIFPAERPVRTRTHEEVSAYYGEQAKVSKSLVGDNCIIEGELENCIVFSGARVAKGAKVRNSIIMRGCDVGEGVELSYVIADKNASFSPNTCLTGSSKLPTVVPKNTKI